MHTNVHCSTVYNSKDLEQPKCPSMIDWTGKMWHICTMEYYAAIKNNEFVSFVGTWMNVETIILSKLTQEQKMKYHMFSLIGGCWKWEHMDTRRGASHTGVCWEEMGGTVRGGELGRDSMGRNAKCGWRGEEKQSTLPCVYLRNCLACSAHVPQNLKCKKKFKKYIRMVKPVIYKRSQ